VEVGVGEGVEVGVEVGVGDGVGFEDETKGKNAWYDEAFGGMGVRI
jgi:hypothetical protein